MIHIDPGPGPSDPLVLPAPQTLRESRRAAGSYLLSVCFSPSAGRLNRLRRDDAVAVSVLAAPFDAKQAFERSTSPTGGGGAQRAGPEIPPSLPKGTSARLPREAAPWLPVQLQVKRIPYSQQSHDKSFDKGEKRCETPTFRQLLFPFNDRSDSVTKLC